MIVRCLVLPAALLAGERIVRDRKGFKLDVDLTIVGKRRLTGR